MSLSVLVVQTCWKLREATVRTAAHSQPQSWNAVMFDERTLTFTASPSKNRRQGINRPVYCHPKCETVKNVSLDFLNSEMNHDGEIVNSCQEKIIIQFDLK